MLQQKVLEKHDELLSSALNVPKSFSMVPPRPVEQPLPTTTVPRTTEIPTPRDLGSAAVLGPMVGSILNMFHQIQQDDDNELEGEEVVEPTTTSVLEKVDEEEISKEISKELEELKPEVNAPAVVAETS